MSRIEQERYVNEIRDQYSEKETTKIDELRRLDKKVKRPAKIFAYIFGVVGALVLGAGMCLSMRVIGDLTALGVVVGVIGVAMVAVNYFIYNAILKARKRKYSDRVISLSNGILNE